VREAWVAKSTAGVVAEAEPLGERCRLPRVLQGWVGLRSECPAGAIGGNGVTCDTDACLQVRCGLMDYIGKISVFEGLYALLRDGCVSGIGMHEGTQSDAWIMRSYLLHCLGIAGHAPAISASV
jgi:hypothetical protein